MGSRHAVCRSRGARSAALLHARRRQRRTPWGKRLHVGKRQHDDKSQHNGKCPALEPRALVGCFGRDSGLPVFNARRRNHAFRRARLHRGRRMAAPLFGGKRPCSGHRIRHSRTPLYGIRHVRRYAAVDYFHSGRRGWRKPRYWAHRVLLQLRLLRDILHHHVPADRAAHAHAAAVGGHGSRCEQRVRVHHFRRIARTDAGGRRCRHDCLNCTVYAGQYRIHWSRAVPLAPDRARTRGYRAKRDARKRNAPVSDSLQRPLDNSWCHYRAHLSAG